MIVILCESFQDAINSFRYFLHFLEDNEPWSILQVWEKCQCVETDENLRYIFVDYRFEHAFDNCHPDIVDAGNFFGNIGEYMYFGYMNL